MDPETPLAIALPSAPVLARRDLLGALFGDGPLFGDERNFS